MVEVRSTTKAKEVHVDDLALQRHVYEAAGLSIRRCFVIHPDREYICQGEIEPRKVLTRIDVTDDVDEVVGSVGPPPKKMVRTIRQRRPRMCWKDVPSEFTLTYAGAQAFDWFRDGIVRATTFAASSPTIRREPTRPDHTSRFP